MHRVFLLTVFTLLVCAQAMAEPSLPPHCRQAVVVLTDHWDGVEASLRLFERRDAGAPWQAVGEAAAAVVGRKGLGWGIGLHADPASDPAPVKSEGDGKAPAGIFLLDFAFGEAPAQAAAWIKLAYRQMTDAFCCVDDGDSPLYNRIVDTSGTPVQWRSHEEMRRQDGLYKIGIVVRHNADSPVAGKGSCIFMHIWRGPSQGTAGCTALAETDLRALLGRLDPALSPVLVQLPRAAYQDLRERWGLP